MSDQRVDTWSRLAAVAEITGQRKPESGEAITTLREVYPVLGREFAGYTIVSLISPGGSSVVFEARNASHAVALKVPCPEIVTSTAIKENFYRERGLLKALRHPNIVNVWRGGEYCEIPYNALELIHGNELPRELDENDDSALLTLLRRVRKICDAVEYLHSHGIIHRDIKPDNILIEAVTGRPVLIDLESSHAREEVFESGSMPYLPPTGVGTFGYMPPEQLNGARPAPQDDVFAIGATLYRILYSTVPYLLDDEAPSDKERLVYRTREGLLFSAPHKKHVPEALRWLINKATQLDPNDRHQSVAELCQELDQIIYTLPERKPTFWQRFFRRR